MTGFVYGDEDTETKENEILVERENFKDKKMSEGVDKVLLSYPSPPLEVASKEYKAANADSIPVPTNGNNPPKN